jgi:hypothetical protein
MESYPTPSTIVRAARFGHCSIEEACMELSERTEGATAEVLAQIKASIEMVRIIGGNVLTGIQGIFTFVWAKTGQLVTKATEAIRLTSTTTATKLTQADLTVQMRRPATEGEFYERLHYFTWILMALGITSYAIVMRFVKEAIFDIKRRLALSWTVCHEMFVLYLDAIETGVHGRAHAVYDVGRSRVVAMAQVGRNGCTMWSDAGSSPCTTLSR